MKSACLTGLTERRPALVNAPAGAGRRILVAGLLLVLSWAARGNREVLSLDGQWEIADSVAASEIPRVFARRVPVPGLVNLAQPAFPRVDEFWSRELIAKYVREGKMTPAEQTNYWHGKTGQDRNYFWYRQSFRAPRPRAVALLKVAKAQFGTAVWLNGRHVGDYAGCFSAGYFDLTPAIKWSASNELLIRVGAHPAVLPDTFPTGSDFEKNKWTPGIYDSVSVLCMDNAVIESVQVAPQIKTGEILVETRLRNYGPDADCELSHRVSAWKGGKTAAVSEPLPFRLARGETKAVLQTIRLPQPVLWSPENPFLYVLESRTCGDNLRTRFGMREFRFDAASRRAWLNGKVYYLRGSNITLHRFFEDPVCRDLPWNEAWVRKLLGDLPKKLNWNYFRFCIGPVPDRWLDICDEEGLLIQNEFFVWTGGPGWYKGYSRKHDVPEMIRQYQDWMRDNWNHPSVVVWDANNETKDEDFGRHIIPAVRPLDLSKRPWENSYNAPADPNDPVEDHPYLMYGTAMREGRGFRMEDLEKMDGAPRPKSLPSDTNPPIINEYGWLWLNRDGSPTLLTEKLYPKLLGPNATAEERFALNAYLLAGKTEFWRAHRHYAGVIHFVYLTCSYPGVYTSDHFLDVPRLKLEPHFADYVAEAFKPLGVYIHFWQPELKAGDAREFKVMLINDTDAPVFGTLELALEPKGGKPLVMAVRPFALEALGQQSQQIPVALPDARGDCLLKAVARPARGHPELSRPTVSRRWVKLVE